MSNEIAEFLEGLGTGAAAMEVIASCAGQDTEKSIRSF